MTPILTVLFVLAAVMALFAFGHVARARRHRRERHYFAATLRLLWGAVFLLLALLCAGGGMAILGYHRLTAESLVATLQSRQLAPQRYAVELHLPDGSGRIAEIAGDDWQLDARVIKWDRRAVALGAPALYRLDRLSGRYRSTDQETSAQRSVVALGPEQPADLWRLKQRFPRWLPWVDADYGSGAYLPLVDGGRFTITLAASGGLVARPADAATEALLAAKGG